MGFLIVYRAILGSSLRSLPHLQPLVQVSPIIIMVAVATPSSPPPQHSPIFGHLASSHTVARPFSLTVSLKRW